MSRINGNFFTETDYRYIIVEKGDYLKFVDRYEVQDAGYQY